MFYRCIPAAASRPATLRAPAKRARGARRHFTVDIHCHLFSPEAEAVVKPFPTSHVEPFLAFSSQATIEVNRRQYEAIRGKLSDVETRLSIMDSMGIDVQAVSPSPHQYYYWADPELGRKSSRLINERLAEIAGKHPERFVGLGTVPLQAPDLAVAELEHMVKKLGLRGVEVATNVNGAELSEDRFRPFWAKAEELGILVFMHPSGFTDGRRLGAHYFINVIGNPLESTIATSHLIFGGVLDAYPKLKICIAHGGGYLAAYSGRMDHAHGAREDCRLHIKRPPTHYLKKLYFDTVVFTTHQLEYLASLYGSDHILLGTDYPFDMGMEDPVGFIESAGGLGRNDKASIMGLNAARLLKLRPPTAKPVKRAKPARAAKRARPAKSLKRARSARYARR